MMETISYSKKDAKALIYAPFQEHTFQEPIHQDFGNISCGTTTLEWAWGPSLIHNKFETKVLFHNDDDVGDDNHIIAVNTP